MQNLDDIFQNQSTLKQILNLNKKIFPPTQKTLKLLLSLVSQTTIPQDFYLCGLGFLLIINEWPQEREFGSIEIANSIFLVCENLKGSILANKLAQLLLKILEKLAEGRDTNENAEITQLLIKESSIFGFDQIFNENSEKDYKLLINIAKNDQNQALLNYLDLIKNCNSLGEQLQFFTEKSNDFFSNLLENKQNRNLNFLLNLAKFLDIVVFEYYYYIQIEESDLKSQKITITEKLNEKTTTKSIEKPIIVEYKYDFLNELIQLSPNFFPMTMPIIDHIISLILIDDKENLTLLDSDSEAKKSEILKILVSILSRLYFNFNYETENIISRLLKICDELSLALNFYEEAKKEITLFMEKLELAKQNEILLKFSKFFDFKKLFSSLPQILINDLTIKAGFPLSRIIEAGEKFESIIEIWVPNSIIHLGFATKWYDIDIELLYLGNFDLINFKEEILIKHERMKFEETAYRCTVLAGKTGLYKIKFSNCHSWFNEKYLRYRIFVLESVNYLRIFNFPFKKLTYSEETLGKYKEFESKIPENPYFIGENRLLIYLEEKTKNINIIAKSNQKTYEMNCELNIFDLDQLKDKILLACKKTFGDNFKENFQEKQLDICIIDIQNSFPIEKLIKELNINNLNLKEINGQELIVEQIKKEKNYDLDRSLFVFVYNNDLNVVFMNNIEHNYANLLYNGEKIENYQFAYKNYHENKEKILILCILNTIFALNNKIKYIIINNLCNEGINSFKNSMNNFKENFKGIDLDSIIFEEINVKLNLEDFIKN